MCGRFTQAYTWQELVALYRLIQPPINLRPNYNIAPTTTIDVIVPGGADRRELVRMRWGLIPSWWKKTMRDLPSTFNARAETVAEKPMFSAAFKQRRCVIPASGYYEWKPTPTGKQPYYFSANNDSVLSFAGLWDEWHNVETSEIVKSCTIIVTSANNFARNIYDRMPVILDNFEPWLSALGGAEILKPAPDRMLKVFPVSRKVNRVANETDPTLISPLQ